jgi:hypothetical protein
VNYCSIFSQSLPTTVHFWPSKTRIQKKSTLLYGRMSNACTSLSMLSRAARALHCIPATSVCSDFRTALQQGNSSLQQ